MASTSQVILTSQEDNKTSLESHHVDFSILHSGAGTFQLETSADGSTWHDVGAAISANGKTDITANLLAHVRVTISAGAPVATLLWRAAK